MKTKKPILRLAALAALSFFTGNELVAQNTLGAACGCPNVSDRSVTYSITQAGTNQVTGANNGGTGTGTWTTVPAGYGKELAGNVVLTCDKMWTLNEKVYIGQGSTLTIQPGTVIKGGVANSPAEATALIIERGGKIIAPGSEDCAIVFTANADAMDGLYPVTNKGMWGGVLILGKAKNNLTYALNGPFIPGSAGKLAAGDGLGVVEGFASSYPQDQFGVLLSGAPTTSTANAVPGTYDMFFDAVANASANGTSQNKISITSSSQLNLNLQVGQPIYTGTTLIGYVGEISTSSPHSSNNPRITLSSSATSLVAVNLPAAIAVGDDVKIVGTYPTNLITTTPTQYSFLNYTGSLPYAAGTGTGPYVLLSGTTYVNMSAPYFGGTTTGGFDNDDNSGVMSYVSIRHAGANLLVGSEINGLTLASVGRGTKIDHIEIVSCADDNIEIFGGTVNIKYCTTLFGNDDMYDYDLGWDGKAQFLFGMKANTLDALGVASGISIDNDNGFEADGGDNNQLGTATCGPSNPTIYNATIVGNTKTAPTADNRTLSAMNFKEGAQGTINNSVFANFMNGLSLTNTQLGSSSGSVGLVHNSYHNWTTETLSPAAATPNTLKVKCNTFIGIDGKVGSATGASTGGISYNSSSSNAWSAALPTNAATQFTADHNLSLTQAEGITAGFDYTFFINGTSNVVTRNDVVPNNVAAFQLVATNCPQAPIDGFFEPANYRGAFKPGTGNDNWLSDWSYSQVLKATKGLNPCPADINNDGVVNITDFGIFAPAYGNSCN